MSHHPAGQRAIGNADAHGFKREQKVESPLKSMLKTSTMNVCCSVLTKTFDDGSPGSRDGEIDSTSKMMVLQSLLLRTWI